MKAYKYLVIPIAEQMQRIEKKTIKILQICLTGYTEKSNVNLFCHTMFLSFNYLMIKDSIYTYKLSGKLDMPKILGLNP